MPTTRASSKKMADAPADRTGNALQGMAIIHSNNGAPGMPQNQQNNLNLVQIPTDVLSNLLTSIDSLRQEVTLLRNDVRILRNDTPDFLKARQETSLLRTQVRFDMKAIITGSNDVRNQLRVDMNRLAKGHTDLIKGHKDLIKGHADLKTQMKYVNKSVRDLERHFDVQKFTCFNQLPPELRTHIWRLALCQPEVFSLEMSFKEYDGVEEAYYNDAYVAKWPTRKTQIRWVNQEARREAQIVLTRYRYQKNVFLNYEVDTVWMTEIYPMGEPYYDLVWGTLRDRIKRLAIHYSYWNNNIDHISDYGDLIELVLIVGKEKGVGQPAMIEPRKPPSHYSDEFRELEGASWAAMGEKVVKRIREVAQERLVYRKRLMDADDGLSEEVLEDDMETLTLWDTIPKVRFVELISESRLQQIKAEEAAGGVCVA